MTLHELLEHVPLETLKEHVRSRVTRRLDTDAFLAWVSLQLGIHPDDLTGPSRIAHIARKRHLAMVAARRILNISLLDTAKLFNRTDHGTVCHAIERVNSSPELKQKLEDITKNYANSH